MMPDKEDTEECVKVSLTVAESYYLTSLLLRDMRHFPSNDAMSSRIAAKISTAYDNRKPTPRPSDPGSGV